MKAIFKNAELKIYHIFLFVACLISSPQAFQVNGLFLSHSKCPHSIEHLITNA